MKHAILIILVFAGLLCSCQKEEVAADSDSSSARITLTFVTPAMEDATRSLDPSQEKAVSDLNLYLVPLSGGRAEHRYQYSQADITLNLTPGDYELFAIANAGYNLGDRKTEELAELSFVVGTEDDLTQGRRLLMSARKRFSVTGKTSVNVTLERCVAKLSLNITTAAAFGDFTLRSIRVTGVSRALTPFTATRPTSGSEVTEFSKIALSGRSYTAEIYLPENAQGTVPGITDPRQRSREKAPAQATYLHIEGETAGRKVDYYIYLGGNTTDDFNILRNRHYTLDATISGINSVDLRLSTLAFTLSPLPEVCFLGVEQCSDMLVRTTDPQGRYTVSYMQTTGVGNVTLNHIPLAPNKPFQLEPGVGDKRPSIYFTPQTTGNAALTFTLTDGYGYTMQQTLSTLVRDPHPIEASFTMPPAPPVVGLTTQLSLEVNETDYKGTFDVTFSYCNDTDTEVTIDGDKTVPCGQTISLTPGQHRISFIPKTAGNKLLRAIITDCYGQSKQTEIIFDVREQVFSATVTAPASFDAHTPTPISLTLSEEYYTGDFSVGYISSGKDCVLYYGEKQLSKNTPITLGAGTHVFNLYSTHAEAVSVTFTVTDQQGKSRTATYDGTCNPLVINVTLTTDVESVERTITEGTFTGTQSDPLTLVLTAKADKPVPGEVTFVLKNWYYTRYYAVLTSYTESFTNQSVTVKIPTGGISTQKTTVASYTGNCVGFSSSARRLLRAGYVLFHEYDRGTGSSIFPVSVDVTGVQNPGIAAGSVEYRYTVVNK